MYLYFSNEMASIPFIMSSYDGGAESPEVGAHAPNLSTLSFLRPLLVLWW